MVKLGCGCGNDKITTTNTISNGNSIIRRHRCKECGNHLKTIEISWGEYQRLLIIEKSAEMMIANLVR